MNIRNIFVSSVMQGYEDRREAARQAIRDVGMTPLMAEDMESGPNPPRDVILYDYINTCDAVVGIYGNRYGWSGAQSGVSPTEEEYDQAREQWKPIYVFIDCMQPGKPEPRQQQFLQKVQNWDTGVTRNEFHSLKELKKKIKQALTGAGLSPRYQSFLGHLRSFGARNGYQEIQETRLPAFGLLLHKPASGVHMTFDPHKLLAVMYGDQYEPSQVKHIFSLWKQTLHDYFKPSVWNQTSLEAWLVIAVEQNPYGLATSILPRERSAKAGGYYGLLVDLANCEIIHPKLRLKDRGVKVWLLEPILQPVLSEL